MSKYMPNTKYEQMSNNHSKTFTTAAAAPPTTTTNIISTQKYLNNNQNTVNNNSNLNSSSSKTQYQLPDRKAKKPRIDDQLVISSSSSITKSVCVFFLCITQTENKLHVLNFAYYFASSIFSGKINYLFFRLKKQTKTQTQITISQLQTDILQITV
jgi:hypothetical protein